MYSVKEKIVSFLISSIFDWIDVADVKPEHVHSHLLDGGIRLDNLHLRVSRINSMLNPADRSGADEDGPFSAARDSPTLPKPHHAHADDDDDDDGTVTNGRNAPRTVDDACPAACNASDVPQQTRPIALEAVGGTIDALHVRVPWLTLSAEPIQATATGVRLTLAAAPRAGGVGRSDEAAERGSGGGAEAAGVGEERRMAHLYEIIDANLRPELIFGSMHRAAAAEAVAPNARGEAARGDEAASQDDAPMTPRLAHVFGFRSNSAAQHGIDVRSNGGSDELRRPHFTLGLPGDEDTEMSALEYRSCDDGEILSHKGTVQSHSGKNNSGGGHEVCEEDDGICSVISVTESAANSDLGSGSGSFASSCDNSVSENDDVDDDAAAEGGSTTGAAASWYNYFSRAVTSIIPASMTNPRRIHAFVRDVEVTLLCGDYTIQLTIEEVEAMVDSVAPAPTSPTVEPQTVRVKGVAVTICSSNDVRTTLPLVQKFNVDVDIEQKGIVEPTVSILNLPPPPPPHSTLSTKGSSPAGQSSGRLQQHPHHHQQRQPPRHDTHFVVSEVNPANYCSELITITCSPVDIVADRSTSGALLRCLCNLQSDSWVPRHLQLMRMQRQWWRYAFAMVTDLLRCRRSRWRLRFEEMLPFCNARRRYLAVLRQLFRDQTQFRTYLDTLRMLEEIIRYRDVVLLLRHIVRAEFHATLVVHGDSTVRAGDGRLLISLEDVFGRNSALDSSSSLETSSDGAANRQSAASSCPDAAPIHKLKQLVINQQGVRVSLPCATFVTLASLRVTTVIIPVADMPVMLSIPYTTRWLQRSGAQRSGTTVPEADASRRACWDPQSLVNQKTDVFLGAVKLFHRRGAPVVPPSAVRGGSAMAIHDVLHSIPFGAASCSAPTSPAGAHTRMPWMKVEIARVLSMRRHPFTHDFSPLSASHAASRGAGDRRFVESHHKQNNPKGKQRQYHSAEDVAAVMGPLELQQSINIAAGSLVLDVRHEWLLALMKELFQLWETEFVPHFREPPNAFTAYKNLLVAATRARNAGRPSSTATGWDKLQAAVAGAALPRPGERPLRRDVFGDATKVAAPVSLPSHVALPKFVDVGMVAVFDGLAVYALDINGVGLFIGHSRLDVLSSERHDPPWKDALDFLPHAAPERFFVPNVRDIRVARLLSAPTASVSPPATQRQHSSHILSDVIAPFTIRCTGPHGGTDSEGENFDIHVEPVVAVTVDYEHALHVLAKIKPLLTEVQAFTEREKQRRDESSKGKEFHLCAKRTTQGTAPSPASTPPPPKRQQYQQYGHAFSHRSSKIQSTAATPGEFRSTASIPPLKLGRSWRAPEQESSSPHGGFVSIASAEQHTLSGPVVVPSASASFNVLALRRLRCSPVLHVPKISVEARHFGLDVALNGLTVSANVPDAVCSGERDVRGTFIEFHALRISTCDGLLSLVLDGDDDDSQAQGHQASTKQRRQKKRCTVLVVPKSRDIPPRILADGTRIDQKGSKEVVEVQIPHFTMRLRNAGQAHDNRVAPLTIYGLQLALCKREVVVVCESLVVYGGAAKLSLDLEVVPLIRDMRGDAPYLNAVLNVNLRLQLISIRLIKSLLADTGSDDDPLAPWSAVVEHWITPAMSNYLSDSFWQVFNSGLTDVNASLISDDPADPMAPLSCFAGLQGASVTPAVATNEVLGDACGRRTERCGIVEFLGGERRAFHLNFGLVDEAPFTALPPHNIAADGPSYHPGPAAGAPSLTRSPLASAASASSPKSASTSPLHSASIVGVLPPKLVCRGGGDEDNGHDDGDDDESIRAVARRTHASSWFGLEPDAGPRNECAFTAFEQVLSGQVEKSGGVRDIHNEFADQRPSASSSSHPTPALSPRRPLPLEGGWVRGILVRNRLNRMETHIFMTPLSVRFFPVTNTVISLESQRVAVRMPVPVLPYWKPELLPRCRSGPLLSIRAVNAAIQHTCVDSGAACTPVRARVQHVLVEYRKWDAPGATHAHKLHADVRAVALHLDMTHPKLTAHVFDAGADFVKVVLQRKPTVYLNSTKYSGETIDGVKNTIFFCGTLEGDSYPRTHVVLVERSTIFLDSMDSSIPGIVIGNRVAVAFVNCKFIVAADSGGEAGCKLAHEGWKRSIRVDGNGMYTCDGCATMHGQRDASKEKEKAKVQSGVSNGAPPATALDLELEEMKELAAQAQAEAATSTMVLPMPCDCTLHALHGTFSYTTDVGAEEGTSSTAPSLPPPIKELQVDFLGTRFSIGEGTTPAGGNFLPIRLSTDSFTIESRRLASACALRKVPLVSPSNITLDLKLMLLATASTTNQTESHQSLRRYRSRANQRVYRVDTSAAASRTRKRRQGDGSGATSTVCDTPEPRIVIVQFVDVVGRWAAVTGDEVVMRVPMDVPTELLASMSPLFASGRQKRPAADDLRDSGASPQPSDPRPAMGDVSAMLKRLTPFTVKLSTPAVSCVVELPNAIPVARLRVREAVMTSFSSSQGQAVASSSSTSSVSLHASQNSSPPPGSLPRIGQCTLRTSPPASSSSSSYFSAFAGTLRPPPVNSITFEVAVVHWIDIYSLSAHEWRPLLRSAAAPVDLQETATPEVFFKLVAELTPSHLTVRNSNSTDQRWGMHLDVHSDAIRSLLFIATCHNKAETKGRRGKNCGTIDTACVLEIVNQTGFNVFVRLPRAVLACPARFSGGIPIANTAVDAERFTDDAHALSVPFEIQVADSEWTTVTSEMFFLNEPIGTPVCVRNKNALCDRVAFVPLVGLTGTAVVIQLITGAPTPAGPFSVSGMPSSVTPRMIVSTPLSVVNHVQGYSVSLFSARDTCVPRRSRQQRQSRTDEDPEARKRNLYETSTCDTSTAQHLGAKGLHDNAGGNHAPASGTLAHTAGPIMPRDVFVAPLWLLDDDSIALNMTQLGGEGALENGILAESPSAPAPIGLSLRAIAQRAAASYHTSANACGFSMHLRLQIPALSHHTHDLCSAHVSTSEKLFIMLTCVFDPVTRSAVVHVRPACSDVFNASWAPLTVALFHEANGATVGGVRHHARHHSPQHGKGTPSIGRRPNEGSPPPPPPPPAAVRAPTPSQKLGAAESPPREFASPSATTWARNGVPGERGDARARSRSVASAALHHGLDGAPTFDVQDIPADMELVGIKTLSPFERLSIPFHDPRLPLYVMMSTSAVLPTQLPTCGPIVDHGIDGGASSASLAHWLPSIPLQSTAPFRVHPPPEAHEPSHCDLIAKHSNTHCFTNHAVPFRVAAFNSLEDEGARSEMLAWESIINLMQARDTSYAALLADASLNVISFVPTSVAASPRNGGSENTTQYAATTSSMSLLTNESGIPVFFSTAEDGQWLPGLGSRPLLPGKTAYVPADARLQLRTERSALCDAFSLKAETVESDCSPVVVELSCVVDRWGKHPTLLSSAELADCFVVRRGQTSTFSAISPREVARFSLQPKWFLSNDSALALLLEQSILIRSSGESASARSAAIARMVVPPRGSVCHTLSSIDHSDSFRVAQAAGDWEANLDGEASETATSASLGSLLVARVDEASKSGTEGKWSPALCPSSLLRGKLTAWITLPISAESSHHQTPSATEVLPTAVTVDVVLSRAPCIHASAAGIQLRISAIRPTQLVNLINLTEFAFSVRNANTEDDAAPVVHPRGSAAFSIIPPAGEGTGATHHDLGRWFVFSLVHVPAHLHHREEYIDSAGAAGAQIVVDLRSDTLKWHETFDVKSADSRSIELPEAVVEVNVSSQQHHSDDSIEYMVVLSSSTLRDAANAVPTDSPPARVAVPPGLSPRIGVSLRLALQHVSVQLWGTSLIGAQRLPTTGIGLVEDRADGQQVMRLSGTLPSPTTVASSSHLVVEPPRHFARHRCSPPTALLALVVQSVVVGFETTSGHPFESERGSYCPNRLVARIQSLCVVDHAAMFSATVASTRSEGARGDTIGPGRFPNLFSRQRSKSESRDGVADVNASRPGVAYAVHPLSVEIVVHDMRIEQTQRANKGDGADEDGEGDGEAEEQNDDAPENEASSCAATSVFPLRSRRLRMRSIRVVVTPTEVCTRDSFAAAVVDFVQQCAEGAEIARAHEAAVALVSDTIEHVRGTMGLMERESSAPLLGTSCETSSASNLASSATASAATTTISLISEVLMMRGPGAAAASVAGRSQKQHQRAIFRSVIEQQRRHLRTNFCHDSSTSCPRSTHISQKQVVGFLQKQKHHRVAALAQCTQLEVDSMTVAASHIVMSWVREDDAETDLLRSFLLRWVVGSVHRAKVDLPPLQWTGATFDSVASFASSISGFYLSAVLAQWRSVIASYELLGSRVSLFGGLVAGAASLLSDGRGANAVGAFVRHIMKSAVVSGPAVPDAGAGTSHPLRNEADEDDRPLRASAADDFSMQPVYPQSDPRLKHQQEQAIERAANASGVFSSIAMQLAITNSSAASSSTWLCEACSSVQHALEVEGKPLEYVVREFGLVAAAHHCGSAAAWLNAALNVNEPPSAILRAIPILRDHLAPPPHPRRQRRRQDTLALLMAASLGSKRRDLRAETLRSDPVALAVDLPFEAMTHLSVTLLRRSNHLLIAQLTLRRQRKEEEQWLLRLVSAIVRARFGGSADEGTGGGDGAADLAQMSDSSSSTLYSSGDTSGSRSITPDLLGHL